MNPPAHDATPRFHVTVTRTSPTTARAEAHGQHLDFAIKGGDPNVGFTPPRPFSRHSAAASSPT